MPGTINKIVLQPTDSAYNIPSHLGRQCLHCNTGLNLFVEQMRMFLLEVCFCEIVQLFAKKTTLAHHSRNLNNFYARIRVFHIQKMKKSANCDW